MDYLEVLKLFFNVVKDKPFKFVNDGLYESDIGSDSDSDSPKALHNCSYDRTIRYEEAVEVTFDIIHSKEGMRIRTTQLVPLGIHVNVSYPHFQIKSRLFYFIEEELVNNLLSSSEIESTLVNDIKRFKNCLSCSNRIKVER